MLKKYPSLLIYNMDEYIGQSTSRSKNSLQGGKDHI